MVLLKLLYLAELNLYQYISARILRGFRIAARLGFQFSSETSNAIHDLSSSIINIDKVYFLGTSEYKLTIVCTFSYGFLLSSAFCLIYCVGKVDDGNELYNVLWGSSAFCLVA